MQAEWPNLKKLVANKWTFHSTEKSFYFFLRHGWSYKLDFWVIISPKNYLCKAIFIFEIDCFILSKLNKNQKVWQMVCPSSWSKINLFTPSTNLITLLFWQFSRYFGWLPCFQSCFMGNPVISAILQTL